MVGQPMSTVASAVSVASATLKTGASFLVNTIPRNTEPRVVISSSLDQFSLERIVSVLTSESTNHSPLSKSSSLACCEIWNLLFGPLIPGTKIAAIWFCRIARAMVRELWQDSCTTTKSLAFVFSPAE